MADILNAAPMVVDQGTRDLSIRTIPTEPLQIPQHLPKFYLFSNQGPLGDTYVDLDEVSISKLYGQEAFDVNSKYFKHQTPFIQTAVASGNNCVIHRLNAANSEGLARVALYLDYCVDMVTQYVRNPDGTLLLDVNGNPTPILDGGGNVVKYEGYKVSWYLKTLNGAVDLAGTPSQDDAGQLTATVGYLTGVDGGGNSTQSTLVPIFEVVAETPGEAANTIAVCLAAPSKKDKSPFPTYLLRDGKQFPFSFKISQLVDEVSGRLTPLFNLFGTDSVRGTYMENGLDPVTGATTNISKIINVNYVDVPVNLKNNLKDFYIYHSNLEPILTAMKTAEVTYLEDVNTVLPVAFNANIETTEKVVGDVYSFNAINFRYSSGAPYFTIDEVKVNPSHVKLNNKANHFMSGGRDGDVSLQGFEDGVLADLINYDSSVHEYNDLVAHPESILYDSGFSMPVKMAMPNFISRRKDTFVVASSSVRDVPTGELVNEGDSLSAVSAAQTVKTMYELHPESATFGTPVMRAMVMCGNGTLINSRYTKRVPTTYEICYKAARYMGAKNGFWKSGLCFDRAPLSVITQLKNIDITWVPAGEARSLFWSAGLNFALNYEARRQFFPALQTVYENDTSVLNSFFTVVAIAYLNKVAHAAWREFSGSISLTNSQLEERVNDFVSAMVKDKFDGLFVVVPNATVTAMDEIRGYSWTLPIKIYANNMKTVMTTYVEAYRMSDLEA